MVTLHIFLHVIPWKVKIGKLNHFAISITVSFKIEKCRYSSGSIPKTKNDWYRVPPILFKISVSIAICRYTDNDLNFTCLSERDWTGTKETLVNV